MDFLVEHPTYKWLVVVPSVSPEHGPVTAGCTMDNQIAFDALHNTLLASYIAGEAPFFPRLPKTNAREIATYANRET